MKQQRLLIAITSGIAILIVLGVLGWGLGSRGQAQEEPVPTAILEYPEFPPTPTVGPLPTDDPAALAGTVLFSDSFDSEASLNDWTFLDLEDVLPEMRSLWKIEDGHLVQDRTANAGNPSPQGTLAVTGAASWTDYTITAKVYDLSNATFGLVARRDGDSFYRYRLVANDFEATPKQVIEKVIDGEATILAEIEAPGYEQRQWHTISLSVVGSTIQASLDGKLVAEATDDTLTSGQAGLSTVALGGIFFDDVRITAP